MDKKDSPVIEAMKIIWHNSDGQSYERLNAGLYSYLSALIRTGVEFDLDDFAEISKRFRPGYWFGMSQNGKHYGEGLYRLGCLYNKSAALAYEDHYKRLPFILQNSRVYENFQFKYSGLCCTVTGWDGTNETLTAVGYPNWTTKKGRKLFSFDRNQWLEERKTMVKEPPRSWMK